MNIELNIAASKNNIEEVKKLYKKKDLLNVAIAMTAQNGHKELLEYLLTLETTLEDKELGLNEALFYASQNNYLEIVEFLLANGASFNRKGRTALHAAACWGNNEIIEKLINAGMNVNVLDEDDSIPLCEAIVNKRVETVKILLEKGSNPLFPDEFGITPKDLALDYGGKEIKKLISIFLK